MKSRQLVYLLSSGLIAGMLFNPASAFAYQYYNTNDDYNDPYNETEEIVYDEITKDTSWFDYDNPKKVYTISNERELLGFASLVNQQQIDRWKPTYFETFENVTIELDSDIVLTKQWKPIGTDKNVCFKGTFNGNGHKISGLSIDTNSANTGLFGYLDGTVKNLLVEGTVTSIAKSTGAIAGYMTENARIRDCSTNVAVLGRSMTGGICGYNAGGSIYRCLTYADVMGTLKVGGIVGENRGSVRRCGNRGSVISTSYGSPTYGTGGIAGRSVTEKALIKSCYNVGEIHTCTDCSGGIVGYANATGSKILSCYNIGDIYFERKASKKAFALKDEVYIGGIAGTVDVRGVQVNNCYSTGEIANSKACCGGIIGRYNDEVDPYTDDGKKKYIINNYYISSVKDGIGANYEGKAVDISGGTKSTNSGTLVNGQNILGIDYKGDLGGEYGSEGYPVLEWQGALPEDFKTFLPHISKDVQKKLNRAIENEKINLYPGNTIMMYFDHNILSAEAFKGFSSDRVNKFIKDKKNNK